MGPLDNTSYSDAVHEYGVAKVRPFRTRLARACTRKIYAPKFPGQRVAWLSNMKSPINVYVNTNGSYRRGGVVAATGGRLLRSSSSENLTPEAVDGRQFSGTKQHATARKTNFRIASWNVDTLTGKAVEVAVAFHRRKVDIGCVQETRWKGEGTRRYGKSGDSFKVFFMGGKESAAGVGVFVAEKWEKAVVAVNRFNERMMSVKLKIGERILNVFSVYAPQGGRPEREKETFWIELLDLLDKIPEEELLFVAGDFNGHIGNTKGGYEGVHGGFGFGVRNVEGDRILEAALTLDLTVCNSCFKKGKAMLVSYASGGVESTVDYVLMRQRDRYMLKDAKMINGEECVLKHKLLVVDLIIKDKESRKDKFVPKLKVWLLRENKYKEKFAERMREKDFTLDEAENVNGKWLRMKKQWKDIAEEVVGWTKGKSRHRETWWWNDIVEKAVEQKKKAYKDWFRDKNEINLESYKNAKREARREVAIAKSNKGKEIVDNWKLDENPGRVFRIAKRLGKERQDIEGVKCLRSDSGKIVTNEVDIKETWRIYMEKVMNEEFDWKRNIESVKKEGPASRITESEVYNALKSMKLGKAPGLSGVVSEMFIAGEDVSVVWLTDLCNGIIKEGHIPEDWKSSVSIPIYKGKGDPMDCGSYRGVKLLEHPMKLVEKVLEKRIRAQVHIDEMQFGFMPGRGTTDAIFIARQLQEKYLDKKKDLYFAFVDLEKAFDRVPREVTRWALRQVGVEEWLVQTVLAMYEEAKTVVRTPCGDSAGFTVNVGVHQGSILSPLLFVIVMEAITRGSRKGLPWELLYADDLILVAESVEELRRKLHSWKVSLEEKGMRVNIKKTKVMVCGRRGKEGVHEKSGKFPCGICGKGVGSRLHGMQ